MSKPNLSLNTILDDEFLVTLAKSADLYKIGSNSVLDPEEIRIGLKVVPRAVMSMLISELVPMEINSHKDIKLPFGISAYVSANKNASDDYTGSVYSNNKLVYDFKNRSIPGLGLILLSTFELYDVEKLNDSQKETGDIGNKVQKLIDERMELHSLVGRVVEDKMAQREAIHKLMMDRLSNAMKPPSPIDVKPEDIAKKELEKAGMFTTGRERIPARELQQPNITPQANKAKNWGKDLGGYSPKAQAGTSIGQGESVREGNIGEAKEAATRALKYQQRMPKPNLGKSEKGSPLKGFLDRKKNKSKEYKIEMTKSETVSCPDCGQTIFGKTAGYSGCICYGPDQNRKIWLKKTEDGVQIRFSKGWDPDNISQLLETLRKK